MAEIREYENIKIAQNYDELEKIRYSYFLNDISEQTKSEYINNEIVIHSPAKVKHIDANISLTILLRLHVEKNNLGWLATEKALVKMKKAGNHYEPDVCFFDTKKSSKFKPDTYHFPPPNLAIEILSKTSIHRDRKQKYKDYANHNVEEYWIVDSDTKEVEQYYLQSTGKYILVQIFSEEDSIKSSSVKDFEIPVAAIFYPDILDKFLFGRYEKGLADLEQKLKEKDKSLLDATNALEEKDKSLLDATNALEEKDKSLLDATNALEEKDKFLLDATNALEEKETELLKQAQLIKKLQEKLKKTE